MKKNNVIKNKRATIEVSIPPQETYDACKYYHGGRCYLHDFLAAEFPFSDIAVYAYGQCTIDNINFKPRTLSIFSGSILEKNFAKNKTTSFTLYEVK